jgi:glycosyltransferase involved in cell wall biosynthesis
MKISYIVPCYNHSQYVLECLESIKADLFCESEIIIIDDGSSDDSADLIEQWHLQNTDLNISFSRQKNQGICYTLNKLIALSSGDFIRTVASDDQIILGSTAILVDALNNNEHSLTAFGDVETMDKNGITLSKSHIGFSKKNKQTYKTDLKKAIISEWAIAGPSFVCKKNFFDTIGKYDESILIEDWNMYLRLAALEKLVFVDTAVARYRVHDTNTSRTKDIAIRKRNLNSQYLGGAKCLSLFSGKYFYLLMSEILLIKAKIHYLNRNVFKLIFNAVISQGYRTLSHLSK